MVTAIAISLLAISISALSEEVPSGDASVDSTVTVCELLKYPAAYSGKAVRIIHARLESDGLERMFLADERCPVRFVLGRRESDGNDKHLDELFSSLTTAYTSSTGDRHYVVVANVDGRFYQGTDRKKLELYLRDAVAIRILAKPRLSSQIPPTRTGPSGTVGAP